MKMPAGSRVDGGGAYNTNTKTDKKQPRRLCVSAAGAWPGPSAARQSASSSPTLSTRPINSRPSWRCRRRTFALPAAPGGPLRSPRPSPTDPWLSPAAVRKPGPRGPVSPGGERWERRPGAGLLSPGGGRRPLIGSDWRRGPGGGGGWPYSRVDRGVETWADVGKADQDVAT